MNRRAFLGFLIAAPIVGPSVARTVVRGLSTISPKLGAAWADDLELVAITRRAFVPKTIVQMYKATPLLSAMLKDARGAVDGGGSVREPMEPR